jgi:hypothetical protein
MKERSRLLPWTLILSLPGELLAPTDADLAEVACHLPPPPRHLAPTHKEVMCNHIMVISSVLVPCLKTTPFAVGGANFWTSYWLATSPSPHTLPHL